MRFLLLLLPLLSLLAFVRCAPPPKPVPAALAEFLAKSQFGSIRNTHEFFVNLMRDPQTRQTIQDLAIKQLGPKSAESIEKSMELMAKLADKAADPRQVRKLDILEQTFTEQIKGVLEVFQPQPVPPHQQMTRNVQRFAQKNQQAIKVAGGTVMLSALLSYLTFHPAGQEAVRQVQRQITQTQLQWKRSNQERMKWAVQQQKRLTALKQKSKGAAKSNPFNTMVLRPAQQTADFFCEQGGRFMRSCSQAIGSVLPPGEGKRWQQKGKSRK